MFYIVGMSRTTIITAIVILLSKVALTQQHTVERHFDSIYKSNLPLALKISKIDSLIDHSTMASDSILGAMHHSLGLLHYNNKNFEEAFAVTQKAIVFRESPGQTAVLKHNSQYNLSFYYNALGQKQKRIEVLNTIVNDGQPDRFTYKSLIELGYYYSDLGDYFKSLKSLELVVNGFDIHQDERTLALGYMGLIYVMSLMEADEIAQLPYALYIDKAEALADQTTAAQLAACRTNIGRLYEQLYLFEESIAYYSKALAYYKVSNATEQTAILFNNLGSVKGKAGKNKEAILLYKQALSQTSNFDTKAIVYDNLGYYTAEYDKKEAVSYFEKAILSALELPFSSDFQMPTRSQLESANQKSSLLRILIDYAQFLHDGGNSEALKNAKQLVLLADYLITLIRDESQLERSKLLWIGRGVNIYMLGVKICFEQQDQATAFYFMERNKAMLLLEQIQNNESSDLSQIPLELQKRHHLLRARLESSSQGLFRDSGAGLKEQYLTDFAAYNSLLDSLKANYTNYLEKGRHLKIKSWSQAKQEYIDKESAFVTYILDDDHGFGIYADHSTTRFFTLAKPNRIYQLAEQVINLGKTSFTELEHYGNFWRLSHELFLAILPIENAADRLAEKRLIVVPDNILHQLSFELLTTTPGSEPNINLPYLIRNTRVAYLHSFSVDGQLKNKETSDQKAILAITPGRFKTDSLTPLRRSQLEGDFLSDLFKVKVLKNEQASKSEFISQMGNYDVIHLSTHAGYDRDKKESWLALFDSVIRTNELYRESSMAEMVTLGACKTAEGLYAQGEGTLSLSRAFFITGTRSVLASLWNANEKANSQILADFYKNLSLGQSKDLALHNAKVNYLSDAQLSEASPYYWANLTITGRLAPVNLVPAGKSRIWILILVSAALLAGFLLRFKITGKTL